MKIKRLTGILLLLAMVLSLCACNNQETPETPDTPEVTENKDTVQTVTVTDMIGREVEIIPGSYQRVVCIGAGALRMYSYDSALRRGRY